MLYNLTQIHTAGKKFLVLQCVQVFGRVVFLQLVCQSQCQTDEDVFFHLFVCAFVLVSHRRIFLVSML